MATTARSDVPTVPGVDDRDVSAATRYLTVLPEIGRAKDAPGLYVVVSDSGREYLVDHFEGACGCPDHRFRGVECLHLRRVAMAIGERPVPDGIPAEDVDPQLGIHCEGDEFALDDVDTDAGGNGGDA